MNILIIAPAWVGDMVMAQCLFKELKKNHALVEIDVVAPSSTFPLAARMPEIRQAYELKVGHGGLQWQARLALGKILRENKYDQAIVLTNSWKSALIPFFAHIKKRTGWRGEFRYFLLNDLRILHKQKLPLMIERFCALGIDAKQVLSERLLWPELQVDPANQQRLKEKFNLILEPLPSDSSGYASDQDMQHPVWNFRAQGKVLAICPGAEFGASKRWPAAYFAKVAQNFLNQSGQVWILGGPKDRAIAEEIQTICDEACVNLAGNTRLIDAIDLLDLASVVATNDSGLMHIAAAVQTPLVVMYGSTSPSFTPPLSEDVEILSLELACSPCFQRTCQFDTYACLTKLMPDQVIAAINRQIGNGAV
jgi:heptosyltransferase-2